MSYETNKDWFDYYLKKANKKRVDLQYRKEGWNLSELDNLDNKFDFIFIDGGDRTNELLKCFNLCQEDGIVFLHDAHREEYKNGILKYPHYYFADRHSCIMCKNNLIYEKIKLFLPLDDSCTCKYCISEDRRNYFEEMKDSKK
ncbi:MAG: hypothetical protein KAT05_07650 [Spirochaetes bacterium]|nr:hypothetical protein [Spirochaetota bacterium]